MLLTGGLGAPLQAIGHDRTQPGSGNAAHLFATAGSIDALRPYHFGYALVLTDWPARFFSLLPSWATLKLVDMFESAALNAAA
jgi:hypothetical protein